MDTSQLKMAAWGLTFPPPSGQLSHTVAGLEGARLQAFGLGDERGDRSRLMICLPPRHGKSLIQLSVSSVVSREASRSSRYFRDVWSGVVGRARLAGAPRGGWQKTGNRNRASQRDAD